MKEPNYIVSFTYGGHADLPNGTEVDVAEIIGNKVSHVKS